METQELMSEFKILCDKEAIPERVRRHSNQLQELIFEVGDQEKTIRACGTGEIVLYEKTSTGPATTQLPLNEQQYEELKKYYLGN